MNRTKMLLTMTLAIAIAVPLTMSLRADDKGMKDMKGMKDTKDMDNDVMTEIPATTEGIWQAIHKEHAELDETVKSKKLGDVHHHAFAIRDLAKALGPKAAADKKAAVKTANKKIDMLATELDKAGDAGDQVATEVNLKKLDTTLQNLEAQFPKH